MSFLKNFAISLYAIISLKIKYYIEFQNIIFYQKQSLTLKSQKYGKNLFICWDCFQKLALCLKTDCT